MITDLTATRLCYLISQEIEDIAPDKFREGRTTYKEVVKIALLNFYNTLNNLDNEDLKDFKFISDPNELGNFNTIIKYKDNLTQHDKKDQTTATGEEIY